MRTSTAAPTSPRRTAAAATAQALEPEASVSPAPRSQMKASSARAPRPARTARWCPARTRGASRAAAPRGRSVVRHQLVEEDDAVRVAERDGVHRAPVAALQLQRLVRHLAVRAAQPHRRAAEGGGPHLHLDLAAPRPRSAPAAPSDHAAGRLDRERSRSRHRPGRQQVGAKIRSPLPLFSASDPSGLKMRSPKSARSRGRAPGSRPSRRRGGGRRGAGPPAASARSAARRRPPRCSRCPARGPCRTPTMEAKAAHRSGSAPARRPPPPRGARRSGRDRSRSARARHAGEHRVVEGARGELHGVPPHVRERERGGDAADTGRGGSRAPPRRAPPRSPRRGAASRRRSRGRAGPRRPPRGRVGEAALLEPADALPEVPLPRQHQAVRVLRSARRMGPRSG
jgi:hypothetical protein